MPSSIFFPFYASIVYKLYLLYIPSSLYLSRFGDKFCMREGLRSTSFLPSSRLSRQDPHSCQCPPSFLSTLSKVFFIHIFLALHIYLYKYKDFKRIDLSSLSGETA